MPPPPSIVGAWVTSFIAWFPVQPWQFIPDFYNEKFNRNPFHVSGFIDPNGVYHDLWKERWDAFYADPDNFEEIKIASIKHPQPVSVLAYFLFSDRDLEVEFSVNFTENFGSGTWKGTYEIQ